MSYIIWRCADMDQNLWLPTQCDTFEQAADAWLAIVQAGGKAEIMERVPIALHDARQKSAQKSARKAPGVAVTLHKGSMTDQLRAALRAYPAGLSRAQLAELTGLSKTDAGAAAGGLLKRGMVRTEQRSPQNGERPAAGRDTVTVYFWIGE